MSGAPIIYMADANLTLKLAAGGTAAPYQGHVSTAEVVPTAGDEVKTVTLDGIAHIRRGAPTFALHLVGHQDYSTTGLARFLWDNAGKQAIFTLQAYGQAAASAPATPSFTGEVTLAEGNYGGEVDTWPAIDVTLPCAARPTIAVALADDEALEDSEDGETSTVAA